MKRRLIRIRSLASASATYEIGTDFYICKDYIKNCQ